MRHTRSSENRKLRYRVLLFFGASIFLIFFILKFGLPALLRLSTFIASFNKDTTPIVTESEFVVTPILYGNDIATNSAQITVSGVSQEGYTVTLYSAGEKIDEVIVGRDGTFDFDKVNLSKGTNEFYTISTYKNKQSNPSETIEITYKNEPPKLEIRSPENGTKFRREDKSIEISGSTEPDVQLSVNNRYVIVEPNGNFTIDYSLNDGTNKLEFVAKDTAGNEKKASLELTYEP